MPAWPQRELIVNLVLQLSAHIISKVHLTPDKQFFFLLYLVQFQVLLMRRLSRILDDQHMMVLGDPPIQVHDIRVSQEEGNENAIYKLWKRRVP